MAQRVSLGLVGPSSRADSLAQQSAVTLNLYPEVADADAKAIIALHSCPGTALWGAVTGDAVRGQHLMGDRFFAVIGPTIYEFTPFPSGDDYVSPRSWGTINTVSGRVGISDSDGKLLIGDGAAFYALDLTTGVVSFVLNDASEQIRGTFVLWIDGVSVYLERDGQQFRYSDLNAPTAVNGLSYMNAEGDPDKVVAGLVLAREMLLFGEKTIEGFVYTGGTDNAFERISGAFVEYGCLARWSVQKFDNSAVWVGVNEDGRGVVYRLQSAGAPPQPISTPAVEKAIADTLADDSNSPEQITAYTYQELGQPFYVLNLPNGTWAYGARTGLWHRRGWLNTQTGEYERIKQDFCTFWNKRHRCGAYDSGQLLTQTKSVYADNGNPLVRMRETPHLAFQGKPFAVDGVLIVPETGVGLDGTGQGTDPKVMLQYRWDNGAWSNEIQRDLGRIGRPETEVEFGPCGYGRDFVARVSVSDPTPVTFLQGFADVTLGG